MVVHNTHNYHLIQTKATILVSKENFPWYLTSSHYLLEVFPQQKTNSCIILFFTRDLRILFVLVWTYPQANVTVLTNE